MKLTILTILLIVSLIVSYCYDLKGVFNSDNKNNIDGNHDNDSNKNDKKNKFIGRTNSLKQNLLSSKAITAVKDFCGSTFLNSSAISSTSFQSFYQLRYTIRVCRKLDDIDLNNTQIFDEFEFSLPGVTIASLVVTPQDAFTASASCVLITPVAGAAFPTFTLLDPNCPAGNTLNCTTVPTTKKSPFLGNKIPMSQSHSVSGDLPTPAPIPTSICNEASTCCLRYTVDVIVSVVTTTGECPANISVSNCIFANATLCGCAPMAVSTNDKDITNILFANPNGKFLGKKNELVNSNKLLNLLDQKEHQEVLSQCRTLPTVCATACVDSVIPAITPVESSPSFVCALRTDDLCACNQGGQSTNCSFSAVRCNFTYNNLGQTPQFINFTLTIDDTVDLGSIPTIVEQLNCVPTSGQFTGLPGTYFCSLNGLSSAAIVVDYCYLRRDAPYNVTFTVSDAVVDLCTGLELFFSNTSVVTIPAQTIVVDFDKSVTPTTAFLCPDQNQRNITQQLCKNYTLTIDVTQGCINSSNLLIVDDLSQFVAKGAQLQGPIVSTPPLLCSFNGTAIVCTANSSSVEPGLYIITYSLCFCTCDFCATTTQRVLPISNILIVTVDNVTASQELQDSIVCPCFKNCTGCTASSLTPVLVRTGGEITVDTVGDFGTSFNYITGTTCDIFCPELNGTTPLATFELDMDQNFKRICNFTDPLTRRTFIAPFDCNYTMTCCSAQSKCTCQVFGQIEFKSCNNSLITPWNCTGMVPPCLPEIAPLPPSPCANGTVGLIVGKPSVINSAFTDGNSNDESITVKILSDKSNSKLVDPSCDITSPTLRIQVTYPFTNNGTRPLSITVNSFGATPKSGGVPSIPGLIAEHVDVTPPRLWTCDNPAPIFVPCHFPSILGETTLPTGQHFVITYKFTSTVGTPPDHIEFQIFATGNTVSGPAGSINTSDNYTASCSS